eukprot:49680-Eustigmatos_ZCMA.PRE.1
MSRTKCATRGPQPMAHTLSKSARLHTFFKQDTCSSCRHMSLEGTDSATDAHALHYQAPSPG